MSIRTHEFVPNSILTAAQMNDVKSNGVIQVSTASDLADASLVDANVAFVVDEMTMYQRTAAGIGGEYWEPFSAADGEFSPAVIVGIAAKDGTPSSKAVYFSTKLIDGTRVNIHTLEGNTEVQTRKLTKDEVQQRALELNVDTADIPTMFVDHPVPYTYTFEVTTPGILTGAVLAAGGAGGSSGWATANPNYQPQGAPGGAGGLLLSSLEKPCVLLPFVGTYTVTVGGTCPALASYGIMSGQNTTIVHDATGYAVTAVGGGGGGSAASNSGYGFAAANGGSAGSPLLDYALSTDSQAARNMRGRSVPGQGHDAGRTEGYAAPGAGGAGGPGYDGGSMGTAVGGDGVDLFVAFELDANDNQAQLWRSIYTDPNYPGFVAGGGTGRKGTTSSPVSIAERSKGGGGQSNANTADRNALTHTGSGGGAGQASLLGGTGANGAVHIIVPF